MSVFLAFIILLSITAKKDIKFQMFRQKAREDWILDAVGLFFQGILIPILQVKVVYLTYQHFLPNLHASLCLHPILAFCLSFVFVDYLYYWNHRLFHTRWLWFVHQVHHTVTAMDVLGTSRNTLWTSFLIVYLWLHSLFIYLLFDPSWYILGVSLTSALDLWRHSTINPQPTSIIYRLLSPWLTLPQDHAFHHASDYTGGNYSANLKIWDKIHNTYNSSENIPKYLGVKSNLTLTQKLFFPDKRLKFTQSEYKKILK
jgi:sterol desaturase/sphingolipid hydroxylase (fatty acid hydroxylase superfamily)